MTAACTACGCTADNPTPVTASLCRACAQTETPAALKARALAAEAECELLRADVTLWREFGKAAADNHSDALLEWQKGFVAFQTRAEKAERDRDRTIALANAFARAARNEIERERAAIDDRLRREGDVATSRILALADANARLVQWRHDYAEAMRANAELAAIVRALATRAECDCCEFREAVAWVKAHPVAL